VTLARDLRDLRLAQRLGAHSRRLPRIARQAELLLSCLALSGEWSGQAEWCALRHCCISASAFLADRWSAPPSAAGSGCSGCRAG
jgi:hypothetical protein